MFIIFISIDGVNIFIQLFILMIAFHMRHFSKLFYLIDERNVKFIIEDGNRYVLMIIVIS